MKRTIQKVLVELQKESPDLSYIRGLLEGLVEEEIPALTISGTNTIRPADMPVYPAKLMPENEEKAPDFTKVGPIGGLA